MIACVSSKPLKRAGDGGDSEEKAISIHCANACDLPMPSHCCLNANACKIETTKKGCQKNRVS